jgi:hypothetical protein
MFRLFLFSQLFLKFILEFSKKPFMDKKVVLAVWGNYQKVLSDNSFYIWQRLNLEILKYNTSNLTTK